MFTQKNGYEFIINSSGEAGKRGCDGADGQHAGSHGRSGSNGSDGEKGKDISISLSTDVSQTQVKVGINRGSEEILSLGEPQTSILIKTNGGHGGRGGDGGQGHDGYRGADGYSATRHSHGTDGQPGGPGGDGGDGGYGGTGADAGNLTIEVAEYDTDLLMLLDEPQLRGGTGGSGGRGGRGGSGGKGGHGGSSHTWFETVHHHHKDSHGHHHTTTHSIPHHMPGGSDGRRGTSGSDGRNGFDAKSGKHGTLKILIEQKTYPGPYRLALHGYDEIASEDGIIEPGEVLLINELSFKNIGLMPTPSRQNISISLISNDKIDFDSKDHVALPLGIAPDKIGTLAQPLRFRVKPTPSIPTIDSTFQELAYLQFDAKVERVNKSFRNIHQQLQTISIQYPVQLSIISLPPTISRIEEAPFAVKIKNISTQPIGLEAKNPRILEIQLEASSKNKNLTFHSLDTKTSYALTSPIHMAYPELKPGESASFTGTLRFGEDLPAYTQINLNCKLNLGKLDDKTRQSESIQISRASLQLADGYQPDSKADIVLVTNNETDQKTVEHWQEVAANLGTNLSIWNASLYSGLSYTQKRADQLSFTDEMQDKVMVILNNTTTIGSRRQHSTDCLDTLEIMTAAKKNNVATYVMGNGFNLKKSVIPHQPFEEKPIEKIIEDKYYFWQTPSEADLINKARKLKAAYQRQNPQQQYTSFYEYKARLKPRTGCFSFRSTWQLGKISVREGLDTVQPHISYREVPDYERTFVPVEEDVYNIVKLLPFIKKLQYLESAKSIYHETIKAAILSDLVAEALAFSKDKWNGDFTERKLAASLVNMRALSQHNFTNHTIFSDVIFKYEYFLKRLPTTSERYFIPLLCRRTRLRNVCEEKLQPLFTKHFSKAMQKDAREGLQRALDRIPRERLFKNFLHPKTGSTRFDTDIEIEPRQILPESYQPKVSHFKESHHFFKTQAERLESIEAYNSQCHFEMK